MGDIETTAAVEEFKTIIDNIYCNIPHVLDISNTEVIRTYISDHHAIFCLFNETKLQDYKQNSTMKRSFYEKNIVQFSHNLKDETCDIVYEESTRVAFAWFQCVIDLLPDKCFQKRLFKMTCQNRYPWMTNEMQTRITTKK